MNALLDAPVAEVDNVAHVRPANNRSERLAQILVTILLYASPALICAHAARVIDPDIWWHLRTGDWIMHHHAVPHTDTYSTVSAGKPWQAYSWLFELLVLGLFKRLGLTGIVAYSAGMVLAITVALHRMIRRLQSDSSVAMGLTFVASLALGHLFTPRPWLFSILFFVVELDILMQARRTGKLRELTWLPVLFALWANLHIQFVLGLALLGLALTEAFVRRTKLPPRWLAATLAACGLATLANPYGWRIYEVAISLMRHPGGMDKIGELQAMTFRDPLDFAVLALSMTAALVLGRTRRAMPFEMALLGVAAYLSFRSERDLWIVVVVASAILAANLPPRTHSNGTTNTWRTILATAAAGLLVCLGFRVMQIDEIGLQRQLAQAMPVRAAEFIQAQRFDGPIYNDFTWGGYLGWRLRMPVSIDGRGGLHGDAAIDRSVATWKAEPGWDADPELGAAHAVVGPVNSPLVQILRRDPRYSLRYEDGVAAVFVPRGTNQNTQASGRVSP